MACVIILKQKMALHFIAEPIASQYLLMIDAQY
jgi:hypothetical protein